MNAAALLQTLLALAQNGQKAQKSVNKATRKGRGKKPGREKMTEAEKAVWMAQNDAECIAVFTKKGFKDVKPRENVLTYGRTKEDGTLTGWLAKGRKVKKGEKAVRVGPFNLFHISQTDAIVSEDDPKAQQVAGAAKPSVETQSSVY